MGLMWAAAVSVAMGLAWLFALVLVVGLCEAVVSGIRRRWRAFQVRRILRDVKRRAYLERHFRRRD